MTASEQFVTDGGLETDLIYNRGFDLPDFAAFPLLEGERGRQVVEEYYDGVRRHRGAAAWGCGWSRRPGGRAPTGAAGSGTTPTRSRPSTAARSTFLRAIGDRWSDRIGTVEVSGQVGPRGRRLPPRSARSTRTRRRTTTARSSQAFADAGADVATALTLTDTGEALGIVAAAREIGIPVAISFTVETNGKLPTGKSLMEALAETDAAGGPDYFFVNCAHPEHIERGLGIDGFWRDRVHGIRVNASTRSHEELDAMTELDAGDPAQLAAAHRRIERSLPELRIIGGCCGTDARHVAELWRAPHRRRGVTGSGRVVEVEPPHVQDALHPDPLGVELVAGLQHGQQVGDAQGVTAFGEHAVVGAAERLVLRERDAGAGEAVALAEPADVTGDRLDRPAGRNRPGRPAGDPAGAATERAGAAPGGPDGSVN